ncbi:DNA repair and recombination protein RadA [Candidatus Lokiarchaeum ossiferum]|uniref:DNA repair and recombination protein RadA n=1 Tax=Candidatus Lokiarchaeum ossiferum TaxID=2951803 RepID=A0ABY6HY91_9ARCH|nr:DNA repair and recombination protein RadA [Candidatus Lokiarchaeum sp. B-35]
MELLALKSIKPRQIKLLTESGIDSLEALAMSVPKDLEEIDGISAKASKNLVWNARDSLNLATFKQVSTIEENFEYCTTGSQNFDNILNGGISTGRITEVYGAFKSGKTNLSHTLCVTCQLPKSKGGLDGSVLFIDTENTFSRTKVERISKRFGLDPTSTLQNIYHARIFSTDHQLQMIRAAEQAIKEKNAKLIIVDSLMALMRSEYIGIGMLAARQQVLNKLIHDLSRIAETHNIAVLVTNQVGVQMKGSFASNEAIGGNIVAHGCHFRIVFKTKGFQSNSSLERTATVVDAPDLPPESAVFYITEAGISDDETITYMEEGELKTLADLNEEENLLIATEKLEKDPVKVKKSTSSKKKKSTSRKPATKKSQAKKAKGIADPLA